MKPLDGSKELEQDDQRTDVHRMHHEFDDYWEPLIKQEELEIRGSQQDITATEEVKKEELLWASTVDDEKARSLYWDCAPETKQVEIELSSNVERKHQIGVSEERMVEDQYIKQEEGMFAAQNVKQEEGMLDYQDVKQEPTDVRSPHVSPSSFDICSKNEVAVKSHEETLVGEEKRFLCGDYRREHPAEISCSATSECDCKRTNYVRRRTATAAENSYSCGKCDFRCKTSGILKIHRRKPTGEKLFLCDECDYSTPTFACIQSHKRIHTGEKPFSCTECDYKCAQSASLRQHMSVHTGAKPYSCDLCNYRSAQGGKIARHKRIHTREKPYSCNECDYKANQAVNLQRHKLIHTGEKPYPCNECDFRTSHAATLEMHKRTHSGKNGNTERKICSCAKCGYICQDSTTLRRHMYTNSDKKGCPMMYSCHMCSFKASRKYHLQEHMKTKKHSGEQEYRCALCDYQCSAARYLRRHISKKHV